MLVFDEVVEIWLGKEREDDIYGAGTLKRFFGKAVNEQNRSETRLSFVSISLPG